METSRVSSKRPKEVGSKVIVTIVAVAIGLGAGLALLGMLLALDSRNYVESIALSMAIGGALVCLVVAMAGSPSARAAGSRFVVGGRFVGGSDRAQPAGPWVAIPASLLVIATGVLLDILVG